MNLSEIIHKLLKLQHQNPRIDLRVQKYELIVPFQHSSDPYFHFSSLRRKMLVNGTGWKNSKMYKKCFWWSVKFHIDTVLLILSDWRGTGVVLGQLDRTDSKNFLKDPTSKKCKNSQWNCLPHPIPPVSCFSREYQSQIMMDTFLKLWCMHP